MKTAAVTYIYGQCFANLIEGEVSPLLCRYHTVLWNFVSDMPFLYNRSGWQ